MVVSLRTSIVSPSLVYRLLFILALFLPLLFKGYRIFLPCVITFVTVSINSFAFGYLPYEVSVYGILSFIAVLIYKYINPKFVLKINPLYFCLILYVFCVNYFNSGKPQNIFWCIFTIAMGSYLLGSNTYVNRFYMLNAFAIISFILSILYLFNYQAFLDSYSLSDDIERAGWTDPNYLSCIVGMGMVSSLILLVRKWSNKICFKIFWITVIFVSIMSQILMASRGGLLCTSMSVVILILSMKVKARYKVLFILMICCFIALLYQNNYFELFAYRMENDSIDSGRFEIWNMKLTEFINEGNVFIWIFGLGYENAFKLSNSAQAIGFHNDFLAILCGYGIIGLSFFIYQIFIAPCTNVQRSDRPILISLVIYLLLASATLEPLASGNITYWAFYFLILLFTNRYEQTSATAQ